MIKSNYDVVVVGAGIAGLSAAYELHKRNENVLVLEQGNIIGGRMGTQTYDEIPLDLGAKFLVPFYTHILQTAKELRVPTRSISANNYAIERNGKINVCNTKNFFATLFYGGLSPVAKIRLGITIGIQLLKYRKLDYENLEQLLYLDDKSLYDHLIGSIGLETIDYFLDPALYALVDYGTKDVSRALFIGGLKDITSMNLISFEGGINRLCLAIAKVVPVSLNIKVESIERKENEVVVIGENTKTKKAFEIHTKHVVCAVPGDKVLTILTNPTPTESEFFSKIIYSPMVGATFSGKTDSFKKFSTIWYPKSENAHFITVSKNFYSSNESFPLFSMGLREEYYKQLKKELNFTKEYLSKLIEQELPIKDVKVVKLTEWTSGLPIFYPGYLKNIVNFIEKTKNDKQVVYCGDYLQNPSTEGAFISGIKAARTIDLIEVENGNSQY